MTTLYWSRHTLGCTQNALNMTLNAARFYFDVCAYFCKKKGNMVIDMDV